VDDRNGPISYVEFVVHFSMGKSGSTDRPSLSLAPLVVGPYVNGSEWYVAAWFTFSKYDQRIQGSNFILGGGSKTVDLQDVVYTNRPLESGMTYSVYCRAVGKDSTGVKVYPFSHKSQQNAFENCFTGAHSVNQ
jgi:hypothetical protein